MYICSKNKKNKIGHLPDLGQCFEKKKKYYTMEVKMSGKL